MRFQWHFALTAFLEKLSAEVLQKELEEARNEVGILLQRVQALEKEKTSLQNKINAASYDKSTKSLLSNYPDAKLDLASARKTECSALKLRLVMQRYSVFWVVWCH